MNFCRYSINLGQYFERNLARMRSELNLQNEKGKNRIPQNVLEWLEANCPVVEKNEDARIVHGDFRYKL
jgi:aminoglycoside phosphotransferase (APT) family kinase protein